MSTPLPSLRHHNALSVPTGYRRVLRLNFQRSGNTASVEPTDARFTQDSRRPLRWDGAITVTDPALQPILPTDLLTPYGTTVTVELGIRLSDGTESTVPYGVYLVAGSDTTSSATNRTTQVQLIDLAYRIEAYRFESPFVVSGGVDVAEVVNQVVEDRLGVNPNVSATGRTITANRVFGLSPETGPWSELLDVLDAFSLTAWYNRSGQITIGAQTPDANTVVDLSNITDLAAKFDVRPANVVVVRGEPADTPPVQAVAMDDNPASVTYAGETVGGSPYGRVTQFFSSPLILTEQQAEQAAATILARELGEGFTYQLVRPFDPVTDAGDGVGVGGQPLGVDSVTVTMTGSSTLNVRSL